MMQPGHPKDILKGGKRLPWDPRNRLRLLSKFKIQKKKRKIQIKTSMAKTMGLFRDSQAYLGSPGPRPKYRLNPLLIVPGGNTKRTQTKQETPTALKPMEK